MITIASIMRNSGGYLERYMKQVDSLHHLMPKVRVVIGEGDSVDDTQEQLHLFSPGYVEIVDVSHGGPMYGSVDHPTRWDQIATCVRAVLDKVGDPGDALVWVESDLIWTPGVILQLVTDLLDVPAVAPMLMAHGETRFYDTYGYRNHGHQFTPNPPYWHQPEEKDGLFLKIDSCGSCFVAGPHTYDALDQWSGHWPARVGGQLYLDERVTVTHP